MWVVRFISRRGGREPSWDCTKGDFAAELTANTGVMTAIVSAGMAELASAYPAAGAQYYWSFMVSSPKQRPFAAYVNGWMSVLGWWLGLASVCNFIASMVLASVTLWYPGYTIQHWQQWLVFVAIVWLAVAINVFASGLIPAFNEMIRTLCSTLCSPFDFSGT